MHAAGSGAGNWKLDMEIGNWKLETGNGNWKWNMEIGNWKLESGKWKVEWHLSATVLPTYMYIHNSTCML